MWGREQIGPVPAHEEHKFDPHQNMDELAGLQQQLDGLDGNDMNVAQERE